MSGDQFTKLFKYLNERFNAIEGSLEKHDERFDQIMAAMDHELKTAETDEQERLVIAHQLDRHKGWIGQLAKSTNTKLAPEL